MTEGEDDAASTNTVEEPDHDAPPTYLWPAFSVKAGLTGPLPLYPLIHSRCLLFFSFTVYTQLSLFRPHPPAS
ncbi:hypothetical protein AG1IA_02748 [Rhizoctonia solani AG-1 IA]|uniref:Uncharacterized protein n=1 Tax=Thanatephorus cucumeris (strain AG1-IA) TaxID=983506 RepID=L8WYP8_THACA|nr:hypothetical protein AG1IA_02748 [Rhizoctonia solani AG-1 IA]